MINAEKIKEDVLNDFAQRNQYSNWKGVLKDDQSISFKAREFEEEITKAIDLTIQKCQQNAEQEKQKTAEEMIKWSEDWFDEKRNNNEMWRMNQDELTGLFLEELKLKYLKYSVKT